MAVFMIDIFVKPIANAAMLNSASHAGNSIPNAMRHFLRLLQILA